MSKIVIFKEDSEQQNWQILVKETIGTKSILNVGKNLSFDTDLIYFSDGKGLIQAIEKKNGKSRWQIQLGDHSPFTITHDQNNLYVSSFDSHIYSIDKKNGLTTWSYAIPDFYWPDTEVVFDENDSFVFFGDRGGSLRALDKKNGKEVWNLNLGTIDAGKVFIEKSIHFGFLQQTDDEVIVDHFPSEKKYTIDKKSGTIKNSGESQLIIPHKQKSDHFQFGKFTLAIRNNVANQPHFDLFDENGERIWSFQPTHAVNPNEIYQDEQRLYYLDLNNQILSSLLIIDENSETSSPTEKKLFKRNFSTKENYTQAIPYPENANPHQAHEYIQNSTHLSSNRIWYRIKNLRKLGLFSVDETKVNKNYVELQVSHDDNFYNNSFTEVTLDAIFENQTNGEQILVKGFYYDKNLWKIRAKLNPGSWSYTITNKNPWLSEKIQGVLTVSETPSSSIKVQQNNLVKDDRLFVPIGIQDVILDLNSDGNPLNNMGHALYESPPQVKEKYRYIDLISYFKLYENEAQTTLFRYGPENWAPRLWKNLSDPKDFSMEINGSKQGDAIISAAKESRHAIIMSIFSFYPPFSTKEAIKNKKNQRVLTLYLDYIIARYSSQIDIWELSNEAFPSSEWQTFISNYLKKNDPYQHPITISFEQPDLKHSELLSLHHYLDQPKNNIQLVEEMQNLIDQDHPDKAKLISEFGFTKTNFFKESTNVLRKVAWISILQRTGIIFWNTSDRHFTSSHNGNTYLGPNERTMFKILNKLTTDFTPQTKSLQQIDKQQNLAIYRLVDEKKELIYLINLNELDKNRKRNVTIQTNLPQPTMVTIIDPITGNALASYMNNKENTIELPPFRDDIAVTISKQ